MCFVFLAVILVPELCRKLGETRGMSFHQVMTKQLNNLTSENNQYFNVSVQTSTWATSYPGWPNKCPYIRLHRSL